MKRIAIFASGSGTNAENIAKYFHNNSSAQVVSFLTNNPKALVIERAHKLNIPCLVFSRNEFRESSIVIEYLQNQKVDLIVLAGFLWLLPTNILSNYPNKIVNIHPALLPKFGGKGMYGLHVHKAVVESKEKESGITIHMVNEKYDEGEIVFQATCPVYDTDSPEDVAEKVHELEYEHFPKIIEQLL